MQALVQDNVDAIAKARRSAVLPEEQREYFDAIRQRTDAEIADVGKERKQQYWMALAMAGAKMAQSQSPYFATALAEGLESGLTGFNKARADASEKKARLQTRKEDLILKRFEALRGAQADIINDMKAGREMTAADLEMANASSKQLMDAATAESTVRTAKAQATTAESSAKFADETARAGLASTRANIGLTIAQTKYYGAKIKSEAAAAKISGGLTAPIASAIDALNASGDRAAENAEKTRSRNPARAKILEAEAQDFYTRAKNLLSSAVPSANAFGTKANPFIRTPESASSIPQGATFRYPGSTDTFTNTLGAPSAQDVVKARNKGKPLPASPGVAPLGAVRLKPTR
jgi:hypothetical protein